MLTTTEKDDSKLELGETYILKIDKERNGNYNLVKINTNEVVLGFQNNDEEEQ